MTFLTASAVSSGPKRMPAARIAARSAALVFILAMAAMPAAAHPLKGAVAGFTSGFMHPLTGPDHVVAMVAVGLWGAFLGPPALWVLPIVFPLIMALGGAAGILGLPLTHIETGIALSGIVLGLMVLFAVRLPLWAAAVVVGFFAVFHGYAHGVELPRAAGPLEFGIGFVIATGFLHLAGIAFGLLSRWKTGEYAVRAGGAAITAAGVWFLLT